MKFLLVVALLLCGCEQERHGFKVTQDIVGMSEYRLYSIYGQPVVVHPVNKNVIYYFYYTNNVRSKQKIHWYRVTFKNGYVVSMQDGVKVGRVKILKHRKPKLIRTQWVQEIFDHVGSASI